MKNKPVPSYPQIGLATIRWYDLTMEARALKKERGSFHCDCGDCPCYVDWTLSEISLDEMMECDVAKRYYEKSIPYRKKARQAAGAKIKLNNLIKRYNNYPLP